MQVIQQTDGILKAEVPKPTNEEMRNEYDYILAEQLTRNLLEAGRITQEEFNSIMEKNRKSYSPLISRI